MQKKHNINVHNNQNVWHVVEQFKTKHTFIPLCKYKMAVKIMFDRENCENPINSLMDPLIKK